MDVGFFALLTGLMNGWKSSVRSPEVRAQFDLAMIVVRLLAAIVWLFLMVWFYEDNPVVISLQIVVVYLVFMTFDMIMSLANLRRN
jgi:membrane protein YdbS with pleckstrin-like domain